MINVREGEVRPATAASASSPHNNNNDDNINNNNNNNNNDTRKSSNTPTTINKSTATSTTHDDQPIPTSTRKRVNNSESSNELLTPLAAAAAPSSSSSTTPAAAPQNCSQATMAFAPAAPVPASAGVMNPEAMELLRGNGSVVPLSMGGTWQQSANLNATAAMYHQQQHQQSALKIRLLPVPPSITIPPPPPPPGMNPQVMFSDVDVSMTPREFGKMSPVLGPSSTSASAVFPPFIGDGIMAMSPLSCQLASGPGSQGGMATLPSPLKVNVVLRPKPNADGTTAPTTSDSTPVSPTVVKDMQFATPRFLPDTWTFESPPANVYAMLVHQPQPLDLSYQQMTAAMMAPPHMNPQIQFQAEVHQQLQLQPPVGSFGIQTSPLAARMHQLYPHMSPVVVTSPHHQLQFAMPPQQQTASPSGAFSPTVNFSMINFSEIMMLGGVGGGGGDPGLLLPQSSPTSNILKQLLPPVIPQYCGVNVKDITLNELRPHFNKPMAVVAKELGVCITLMKKICRRNGLVRWPHRRIRSLVNRITSLQVIAANALDADQKRFQSQIATLREELSAVIQNPNEKSRKAQADAKARSPSSQMLIKEENANEDDEGEDDEEEEVRESVKNGESVSSNSSNTVGRKLDETIPERDGTLFSKSSESLVHQESSEDVDMHDHEESETGGVSKPGDSKKRKDFVQNSGNALLYPPPPIKIPCYRDGRPRRNSAPEQQHLRALGHAGRARDEALDADPERPSSTTSTSSRRCSILSILCDSAE